MKRTMGKMLGTVVLVAALGAAGGTKEATAGVSVNINLGPPPIVVAAPPELVLVPGLQVYFDPNPEIDIFFYNGYWWSPRGNAWYRARAYNGPWGRVHRRHVPAAVFQVPHDYRGRYERAERIPYGQWKKQHGGGKGHNRDHKQGRGHGHH